MEEGRKLRREAGLIGLLFASMGGIVGSGWLFGPLAAAQTAGPASIIAWMIGAVAVLLLSFVYAELTTAFPRGGAVVAFPKLSHGSLIALIMSWVVFLGYVTVAPAEVLGVMKYAHNYLPGIVTPDAASPLGFVEAAGLLALFVVVNFFGIRWVLQLNTTLVWWKLLVPALTAVMLIVVGGHFENLTSHGFSPMGTHGILSAVSTSGIVFSYLGFRQAIELAGESSNPRRNLPIAVVGSVVIGAILYITLQVALIAAIDPKDLAHGWAKLTFKGIAGPFAGLASLLGLGWLAAFLYIDSVISPAGTGIIYTTTTSRVLFAIGNEGLMSKGLSALTERGVPVVALAITFLFGLVFLFPFPQWQTIVNYISSVTVLSYGIGPVVLLTLRKTLPIEGHPRPFLLKAAWPVAGLAFIISNLIIYWSGADTDNYVFGMILVFFVLFVAYEMFTKGSLAHLEWRGAWWLAPYFVGMWLLTRMGPKDLTGGSGLLPMGIDMVVVAVFSIVILMVAIASGIPEPEEARATILAGEPELLGPMPSRS